MKKASILIVLMTLIISGYAQTSKISGSWLMTKVETPEGIEELYQVTDYNEDGNMVIMGMEVGTWEYNKKNHSIVLKSDFDKDFNGEGKIEKITDKELVVFKDGVRVFYLKVDNKEIAENNKMSGLFGSWEFKDQANADAKMYVTFTAPDEFLILEKNSGMESRSSGTWIFDKQEMTLIMIGLRGSDKLSGESKIVKIEENVLDLESDGRVFNLERKVQSAYKMERLEFTENDFFSEDGDYKYYDEEQKMPWSNWPELKNYLLNVHQLVYSYASLIMGTEIFEEKTLQADVNASLEEEGFNIDYIFDGFDRYNLPEYAALRTNTDYSNPLYPLEGDTYRVIGNEQITTPAGTFDCTVVEAIKDSDSSLKLWLVNDKIGVYAKIIEDKPGSFGRYVVYELQEIK